MSSDISRLFPTRNVELNWHMTVWHVGNILIWFDFITVRHYSYSIIVTNLLMYIPTYFSHLSELGMYNT